MAGLLSGIGDFFGKINTGTAEKPSFVDRLGMFGAQLQDIDDGGTRAAALQDRRDAQLDAQAKAQQRRELAQYADSLGLSPREKLLFMVNPQALGNLIRDQQAPFTLGKTRYGAGGEVIAEAPDFQTFGDQVLSLSSQGVNPVYTRGPTISENLDERRLAEQIAARVQNDAIQRGQLAVSQGNLGVARGNLGLSRERFNQERQGVRSLGPSLPSQWRVNP